MSAQLYWAWCYDDKCQRVFADLPSCGRVYMANTMADAKRMLASSAQFEILHNGTHMTDAVDMNSASAICKLNESLGYKNMTIRRLCDGRRWDWNL